jgi:hypothetical protein
MDTPKKKSPEQTSKPKIDFTKWGKTVRISQETYNFIRDNGEFGDTFDSVLKKLLKI